MRIVKIVTEGKVERGEVVLSEEESLEGLCGNQEEVCKSGNYNECGLWGLN